jgi:hypothetical protein
MFICHHAIELYAIKMGERQSWVFAGFGQMRHPTNPLLPSLTTGFVHKG